MTTKNESAPPTVFAAAGEIADGDLDKVSGGDKATTPAAKPKLEPYLKVTMTEVLITG